MPAFLSHAGNTMVPAYIALRELGYTVTWVRPPESMEMWIAEGPLGRFTAHDPVSLMGLISLWEMRGENWRATDEQIDEFLKLYQE